MVEQKKLEQAKITFDTLCRALDKHSWHYEKNNEKLMIECRAHGDDLPISLDLVVDAERMIILLMSHLPFTVKEDKRLDVAVAVNVINTMLVDGSFDYDVKSGNMFFRMTNSFRESRIGEEAIEYMIFCACQTIDDFNDKLLMLANGMLSVEQFVAKILN